MNSIEIEHALDYAARYFHSHAEQRLKTIRYFLGYILILSAALYKVLLDCHYAILFLGSLLGLIITLFFFILEKRNSQLVGIGSLACRELEDELLIRLTKENGFKFKKINIAQQGENSRKIFLSYRFATKSLFLVFLFLQILIVVFTLLSWLGSEFNFYLFNFDVLEFLKKGCSNTNNLIGH